jgi:hypothetical protein
MPRDEFVLHEVDACCGQPVVLQVAPDGNIFLRCAHHTVAVEGWATDPNGPGLRAVCDHASQRRVRLSGRIVQGCGGLILREVFKNDRARIFENRGSAFLVSIDAEHGRQYWFRSFEESYLQLTGNVWRPEGGQL